MEFEFSLFQLFRDNPRIDWDGSPEQVPVSHHHWRPAEGEAEGHRHREGDGGDQVLCDEDRQEGGEAGAREDFGVLWVLWGHFWGTFGVHWSTSGTLGYFGVLLSVTPWLCDSVTLCLVTHVSVTHKGNVSLISVVAVHQNQPCLFNWQQLQLFYQ